MFRAEVTPKTKTNQVSPNTLRINSDDGDDGSAADARKSVKKKKKVSFNKSLERRRVIDVEVVIPLDKAPSNPCESCEQTREAGANAWAVCNGLVALYNVAEAVVILVLVVKVVLKWKSKSKCKVEPTSWPLWVSAANFLTSLIYSVTSGMFLIAMTNAETDENRVKLTKFYQYSCKAAIPLVGHIFKFIHDIDGCYRVLGSTFLDIVRLSVLLATVAFGHYVAQSYIIHLTLLEHPPETEVVEPGPTPLLSLPPVPRVGIMKKTSVISTPDVEQLTKKSSKLPNSASQSQQNITSLASAVTRMLEVSRTSNVQTHSTQQAGPPSNLMRNGKKGSR